MYAIAALLLSLTMQAVATPPAEPIYKKIAITEPDVQEAVKVVFAKQKGTLISAERRSISGTNIRLCITMNRSSSYEFALVVLSRDKTKKLWTVDTWSWGSCGR
jgi:hypothetical protein